MGYSLNTEAARKADQFFARIEATGQYKGQFTRAEEITSTKGTKGIDLSFKADTGETADYLTIWTHDKDGKELRGFNLVMAIMTCLRVKTIETTSGEVEKFENGAKVKKIVQLYRDLMNKPLGLLIQMEEYPKNAGGTGWKPSIFSVFDKDGFVATEILSKSPKADTLPKMAASLRDRPLKAPAATAPGMTNATNGAPTGSAFDSFEDDIPF